MSRSMFVYAPNSFILDRQRREAAVLARLLAEELPHASWTISDSYSTLDVELGDRVLRLLVGQIGPDGDPAINRQAILTWAAHFGEAARWRERTHPTDASPVQGWLAACGVVDGVQVRVWAALPERPAGVQEPW